MEPKVAGEVVMVESSEVAARVAMIERVGERPHLVASLIRSYGLVGRGRVRAVPSTAATTEELLVFHSREYVAFLGRPEEGAEEQGCIMQKEIAEHQKPAKQ